MLAQMLRQRFFWERVRVYRDRGQYPGYGEQFLHAALLPGFEAGVVAKNCKANLQMCLECDERVPYAAISLHILNLHPHAFPSVT